MKNILILLSAFMISLSSIAQGSYSICGKKLSKEGFIYVVDPILNFNTDSIKLKKGKFKLSSEISEIRYYELSVNNEFSIPMIIKGGEKLKLVNERNGEYTLSGMEETQEVISYMKLLKTYPSDMQKIREGLQTEKEDSKKNELRNEMTKLYELVNSTKKDLANKENSLLPIILLKNDLLNSKYDKSLYAKIRDNIAKSYPNSIYSDYAKDVYDKKFPKKSGPAQIGEIAPELNGMKSPDGKEITLSSLKGKHVLIDFWASWCGPCRRENPNVVNLYEKYKSKGFEVYSVSLDKDKKRWTDAIKKDNLTWPSHISDLKGWGTIATRLYGFSGIPYTVLIDDKGKIVATKLRGAALDNKLKEIYGF